VLGVTRASVGVGEIVAAGEIVGAGVGPGVGGIVAGNTEEKKKIERIRMLHAS
jgi:hypothetical protein